MELTLILWSLLWVFLFLLRKWQAKKLLKLEVTDEVTILDVFFFLFDVGA